MNNTLAVIAEGSDQKVIGPVKSIVDDVTVTICVLMLTFGALIFLTFTYRKFISKFLVTLPRDIRGIVRLIKIVKAILYHQKKSDSVGDVFDAVADANPSKICFVFENQEWSFRKVSERSNQVANYFLNQGYKKGDVIALFMENRPEYVCIWLGLSKIGVVPALINSHVRLQSLKHSFDIADGLGIIFGTELSLAVLEVFEKDMASTTIQFYSVTSFDNASRSDNEVLPPMLQRSSKNLEKETMTCAISSPLLISKPGFSDDLFYMYTSGTTGLPKAAIVNHARYIIGALGVNKFMGIRRDDIVYTPFPLYHTSAGIVAVGQALLCANTLVLRSKFSATHFWRDCCQYRVTVAQYIGETCRYLLAQPSVTEEQDHSVRLFIGNGLRPEIWREFQGRFNIPRICETYGSTDGNCNMMNFDGRVGAVGFTPIWMYRFGPTRLIQVDPVTGEPRRNSGGLAVMCGANEWGELVGKIVKNNPLREFKGYAGKDHTSNEKKILNDVFSNNDAAFRTGDYLVMDELGYFYFKDRSGDTFRWKGENVSTAEVESVISSICHLNDCVVYGVQIPGSEGRAGMAAVAMDPHSLDLHTLAQALLKSLPSYACPLFLRVLRSIEITGTYKLKKYILQEESFHLDRVSDPIFYWEANKFLPLDPKSYQRIMQGNWRV